MTGGAAGQAVTADPAAPMASGPVHDGPAQPLPADRAVNDAEVRARGARTASGAAAIVRGANGPAAHDAATARPTIATDRLAVRVTAVSVAAPTDRNQLARPRSRAYLTPSWTRT
ncbi:hypothetical protein [Jiangella asiatica]|uniref:hypothetical protein n=1 Tax=Jiangella asiatica TaxID=2530372 RepID=UPI00193CD5C6|nr:hypothetical protein [Jiangella asiatica]